MKYFLNSAFIISMTCLAGCDIGPESPQGFSLPQGNAEMGKLVFIKYQCLACHSLEGTEQEKVKKHATIAVPLGGKSIRVTTYAQLLTSVINPSHKIYPNLNPDITTLDGQSKMPIFNDVMTVTELVDLITFLQPHYKVLPPNPSNYYFYKY
jgi:mono/diheme cytochrome c family protein